MSPLACSLLALACAALILGTCADATDVQLDQLYVPKGCSTLILKSPGRFLRYAYKTKHSFTATPYNRTLIIRDKPLPFIFKLKFEYVVVCDRVTRIAPRVTASPSCQEEPDFSSIRVSCGMYHGNCGPLDVSVYRRYVVSIPLNMRNNKKKKNH